MQKNDKFYTQYYDIEKEIQAYLELNPDVFKDKTVILPCDDPEWSNFTRYFAQNFTHLGLKNLSVRALLLKANQKQTIKQLYLRKVAQFMMKKNLFKKVKYLF